MPRLVAQFPLPYYELWDSTGLIISIDTSLFDQVRRSTRELLALDPLSMRTVRVTGFRVVSEDRCCTDDDPRYLIADLAERVDTSRWTCLPAGELEQLRSLPVPMAHADLPDTMLFMTHRGPEHGQRWIWQPDSGDHRLRLERVRPDGGIEDEWTWLDVRRSQCRAWKVNDLTWVECPGSGSRYDGLSAIGVNMLLSARGPVHLFIDNSNSTVDGWGPFHWADRRPIAMVHTGLARCVFFNSGEVLVEMSGTWTYTYREPMRYYGECDCPEE